MAKVISSPKSPWKIDPSVGGSAHCFKRLYDIQLERNGFGIKNVLPNKYFVLGSEPEIMMIPSFFDTSVKNDKITIFIYMNEIENYNLRIEKNLEVNTDRWKQYRFSVFAILLLPVILGSIYVFLEWFA